MTTWKLKPALHIYHYYFRFDTGMIVCDASFEQIVAYKIDNDSVRLWIHVLQMWSERIQVQVI